MELGTNRNGYPLFQLYRWGFIFNEGGHFATLSICPMEKLPFRFWMGGKNWNFEVMWQTWSGVR